MKTVCIDEMSKVITTYAFIGVVSKVEEFVKYATRTPERVQIFPEDYNRVWKAIERKFAKDAREAAKAAGSRGRRDQSFPPETFDALCFRGIPVECGVRASKPVKV